MARSNYGTVGGPRRSGGAAWQWVIIGGTLGFGCAAVLVLLLLTLGILNLDGAQADSEVVLQNTDVPQPTANLQATVQVIVQATQAALPSPTTAPTEPQVIVAPSATPTPTQALVEPTVADSGGATDSGGAAATATEAVAEPQTQATSESAPLQPQAAQQSNIPADLQPFISDTARIDGGVFTMGTDVNEITVAVRECQERDGRNCQLEFGDDSRPAHDVFIDPFEIETSEVTNGQYVRFLNSVEAGMGPGSHANGCNGQACIDTTSEDPNSLITFDSANYDVGDTVENLPAVGVTWFGANAYCQAIGRRLPTEAEWERAARGTEGRIYPWGDTWDYSFARTYRPDEQVIGVVDVRSFPGNVTPEGVFDLAGNASEWVSDWYDPNYYRQPAASEANPPGPPTGQERVKRGGSWDVPPFFARSMHRQSARPNEKLLSIGFRCADDIEEEQPLPNELPDASDSTDLQTTPGVDAAPTLPTLPTIAPLPLPTEEGETTEVPAVPPGG